MCKQKQMKPQVLPKPDSKLSWRKADCIWTIHIFSDTEKEEQGGRWWLAFVRETRPWKQEQLELVSTWQRRWLSFMQSFFTNFSSGITLCYVLQRVFQIWYFSCKFKTQLKFQCWNNYTCGMCSSYWCLASNTIWFWLAEDSYHSSTLASGNYQYFRELFLPYIALFWYAAMSASPMWQKSWLDFPNAVPWALMVRTTSFWSHQRHLWSYLNNPLLIALLLPKLLPRILLKMINK